MFVLLNELKISYVIGPDTKRSVGSFYPNMANPDMAGDGPPTETIMVPDKMVSFIIGRGGETIKRLQVVEKDPFLPPLAKCLMQWILF